MTPSSISMSLNNSNNLLVKKPLSEVNDLSWIIELDKLEMDYSWDESMWKNSDNTNLFLYYYSNQSGYCLFEKSDVFHIYKIVINSNFRRLNLGADLIQSLKADAIGKDIYLEVSDQNLGAIDFYRSQGFKELFHQHKFYSDGTGCLKMSLSTL